MNSWWQRNDFSPFTQLKLLNANEQSSVLKPVSYDNAGSQAKQKSQRGRKSNITLQKITLKTLNQKVKKKIQKIIFFRPKKNNQKCSMDFCLKMALIFVNDFILTILLMHSYVLLLFLFFDLLMLKSVPFYREIWVNGKKTVYAFEYRDFDFVFILFYFLLVEQLNRFAMVYEVYRKHTTKD